MTRAEILKHQFETLNWRAIYQEVERNRINGISFQEVIERERELQKDLGR